MNSIEGKGVSKQVQQVNRSDPLLHNGDRVLSLTSDEGDRGDNEDGLHDDERRIDLVVVVEVEDVPEDEDVPADALDQRLSALLEQRTQLLQQGNGVLFLRNDAVPVPAVPVPERNDVPVPERNDVPVPERNDERNEDEENDQNNPEENMSYEDLILLLCEGHDRSGIGHQKVIQGNKLAGESKELAKQSEELARQSEERARESRQCIIEGQDSITQGERIIKRATRLLKDHKKKTSS